MPPSDLPFDNATLQRISSELTGWLVEKALPVWFSVGVDVGKGECFEAIDLASSTSVATPRRARIIPRQIYSFLEGKRLGWDGPAEPVASALHNWFLSTYTTADGYFAAAAGTDNKITDGSFDLYNQAFALFGFSNVAMSIPDLRENAIAQAEKLRALLIAKYKHPEAGFHEAVPAVAPLRSNPHMHLFEACLAWEAVSDDPLWEELADEIAELALINFIDPVSGGLREFFDLDWSPMPGNKGRIMEPGHQFEWAWLLARWGQSRRDADALIAARRLYDIGRTFGVNESRRVTFMALNDDFTVHDPVARLWGQTEWIKAAVAMTQISTGVERDAYLADIPEAVHALQVFFQNVPDGLYLDKMSPDGTFKEEPAPASSLYHIVCAVSELDAFTKTL
jgi:mannose/cellobiose epimerase-like protein (N-acyl-D-glucosamine 2-epimerase family)